MQAIGRPARRPIIAATVARVIADFALSMSADRVQHLSESIEEMGWTEEQLRLACRELIKSSEFRKTIRYAGTLTIADLAAVIEPEEDVILSSPKGYAVKVAAGKLYTYEEMIALFQLTGGEHGPWRTTVNFAEAVRIEGREKPLWRLKTANTQNDGLPF